MLDVTCQLGCLGVEHDLARWGVMPTLGVGLNEKKRIVATLRDYDNEARTRE